MKLYIPLKNIILGPGKRFDPSVNSEAEVSGFIKKAYGIISSTLRPPIERRKVIYYDPISI
jgi:hypothetical protein